jgi:HK97 family phage major capsid protein
MLGDMNTPRPSGIPLRADRDAYEREQRRSLTRAITAMALSRRGEDPADLLRAAWPHDSAAEILTKAATTPTSTSSYPTYTTAKTLPALAPQSASVRLFASAMQVDLAGVSKVRIPYMAATPQPGFIGEGAAAPLAQFSLAGVDLGPACKLLILSAVTGELENATPESASAIIGRSLAEATAKSLDTAVFGSVAATAGLRPAGLLAGVSVTTATAGGGLAALVADIGNLAGQVADAGIAADDLIIITHPETATKLRLLASPAFTNVVLGTPQVAVGTVIAVAPGGLAVAYSGVPQVEVSREALAHFEDTSPLPIATGAQGSGVLATPVRSAFQTDSLIIRVRCRCAWAALPGAVQYLTGATW